MKCYLNVLLSRYTKLRIKGKLMGASVDLMKKRHGLIPFAPAFFKFIEHVERVFAIGQL